MKINLHALTGGYALDAVAADEVPAFQRHLAACEPCRREVAEFQATATRFGLAATASPPPYLRAAVLDRITHVRQHGWWTRTRLVNAAAAVLLAATAPQARSSRTARP
jgi:anti-sigma factor RsiW